MDECRMTNDDSRTAACWRNRFMVVFMLCDINGRCEDHLRTGHYRECTWLKPPSGDISIAKAPRLKRIGPRRFFPTQS